MVNESYLSFCSLISRTKTSSHFTDSNNESKSSKSNANGVSSVDSQIQESHVTGMNRYPDEYSFVKNYVDTNWIGKSSVKLLSFGSSTGEEVISLATLYFQSPKYKHIAVYGTDID